MRIINGLPEDLDPCDFAPEVRSIMLGLMSNGSSQRLEARKKLTETGPEVLPQVFRMLGSRHQQLRWEAAQVIRLMASEEAIPGLLALLADHDNDIRWIAAKGLLKIGRPSLVPLLELVVEHAADPNIRNGAHHVMMGLLTKQERKEHHKLIYALENYQETGELAPHWAGEFLNDLLDDPPQE